MENALGLYKFSLIGYGYNFLSWMVWLPSMKKLYQKLLSHFGGLENKKVLELGCGTGFLTKMLLEEKANVTSVDRSAGMLALARKNAPGATFIHQNILTYRDETQYDFVAFFFVLHELDAEARKRVLLQTSKQLSPKGKIVIADFSVPANGIMKTLFPRILGLWEPASTLAFLKVGFEKDIQESGLHLVEKHSLQKGKAQLLIVTAG